MTMVSNEPFELPPNIYSHELNTLILGCIEKSPKERWSVEQILSQHIFHNIETSESDFYKAERRRNMIEKIIGEEKLKELYSDFETLKLKKEKTFEEHLVMELTELDCKIYH